MNKNKPPDVTRCGPCVWLHVPPEGADLTLEEYEAMWKILEQYQAVLRTKFRR